LHDVFVANFQPGGGIELFAQSQPA
jgi:hypothetical protein